ncbi:hypothetical protein ROE7235_03574 [Roseibaca ekhonensis]|jgi:hypothetical protein|uniref:Uncharacterized protein n=1 Tax=Roseinatronobacter ekhonensis TaxID=254356 RepID=A0A3B0MVN3_9RHOB|nr:hypothetical protein ROE7235_03574 [Roseibaca ekhonensis]
MTFAAERANCLIRTFMPFSRCPCFENSVNYPAYITAWECWSIPDSMGQLIVQGLSMQIYIGQTINNSGILTTTTITSTRSPNRQ